MKYTVGKNPNSRNGFKKGHKNVGIKFCTHGMSRTSEYKIWQGIKDRCCSKNSKGDKNYSGRGIKVCERWLNFENFFVDMGKKPSDKHSLDRINNNGNYCKENCRWATKKEQTRNTRYNLVYKKECAVDAEKRIGGSATGFISERIRRGWNKKEAFTLPLHSRLI